MKVFLDTTPTYALLDARDQAHERALTIFGRAAKDTLLVPLPTALELHGLLIKRKPNNSEAAHEAVRGVLGAYAMVFPIKADMDAAAGLLARYSDQRLTLTDALIASMAAREGARVLTFDNRHFSLMGAELYGE